MRCAVVVAGLAILLESAETSQPANVGNDNRQERNPYTISRKVLKKISDEDCTLYSLNSASKPRPYIVCMDINDKSLQMEINTGASLT